MATSKKAQDFELYNNVLEDIDRFVTESAALAFNAYLAVHQEKISKINRTLAQHEEQLLEAQEIAQLGSFIWDFTDSEQSYYSPETLKIFGMQKSTNITSFIEDVHEDDRKVLQDSIAYAIENKGIYECEYRYIKPGYEKRIWSRGIVEYKDDKPFRMKGTIMDVSKNHQLLNDLKEKKENFSQLINNAPDAIIVIDENSIVRLWNPKAEIIFGWTNEEIIGQTITDKIIAEGHKDAYDKAMRLFSSSENTSDLNHSIELDAINKKGDHLCISITISKSFQNGERVFIAFLRDITLEKKNTIELRKKTLQLLELNNSLALKNAELERMNAELESFNYVASHDLQEPLRKIQIFSNRLIEKDSAILPQHTHNYIEKIKTSSARMQNLIEDLLSFSQLKSHTDAFENVDLNLLLDKVKDTLTHSIEEKNAVIESTHLPVVNVIPFQFSQLLTNIISNSLHYRKKEVDPHIRISAKMITQEANMHELYKPGKYLELSISDNGIGFESEYAEEIFHLFKRLHNKEKYSGTGIGLSICKKIMHHHEGYIRAESTEGNGATFYIYLPESKIKSW